MGAWGFGLFQSDLDLDIIGDLSAEAGLDDLQKAANKAAKAAKAANEEEPSSAHGPATDDDDDDYFGEHSYSLSRDLCSSDDDARVVRNHLDSGALDILISRWLQNAEYTGPELRYFPSANYHLLIIGACAMTHGCRLDPPFLCILRALAPGLRHKRDAFEQIDRALNSSTDDYKNDGTPYDFGSLGLLDTVNYGDQFPGGIIPPSAMANDSSAPSGLVAPNVAQSAGGSS